jgi:hypothetical protein
MFIASQHRRYLVYISGRDARPETRVTRHTRRTSCRWMTTSGKK